MLQSVGGYLNIVFLLTLGLMARRYAPGWVDDDPAPETVARRTARYRLLGNCSIAGGLTLLILRLAGG